MSSPLENLEPKLLWSHFDAIRKVPRPSKHEQRIAAHVQAWAKDKGFEVLEETSPEVLEELRALGYIQ